MSVRDYRVILNRLEGVEVDTGVNNDHDNVIYVNNRRVFRMRRDEYRRGWLLTGLDDIPGHLAGAGGDTKGRRWGYFHNANEAYVAIHGLIEHGGFEDMEEYEIED